MTAALHPDPTLASPADVAVMLHDGLPEAIDAVAAAGPESHRFLRRQWYAAAIAAYGGTPRTLLASVEGVPALALPMVALGPRSLGLVSVPGCYWPFRSVASVPPLLSDDLFATALALLASTTRGLRIGPVYDGDPGVTALVEAARRSGWGVVSRRVATSYCLDMAGLRAEGQWPRNSTLRKNRFHEKHLGAHGALDWRFVAEEGWPAAFDLMADVEKKSWLAERTDGRDAKFTRWGHGEFFRAAAQDPVIAGMFHAALLTVEGRPAAFSFDIDAGTLKYAVTNSYDPAFAKHSPGKLLYYRNLVEALGRGIAVVDWGAGDSGYKSVIGAAEGPAIRDWLLLRPGAAALAAPLIRRLWRDQGR